MAYKKEDFTFVTLWGSSEGLEMWIYTNESYQSIAYKGETRIDHFIPLEGESEKIFAMLYPDCYDFVRKGLDALDNLKGTLDSHYWWDGEQWQ